MKVSFLMFCAKLVYSEAIMVNFSNSVKCQVPFGIYDCLGREAIVFRNFDSVKLSVTVVTTELLPLKESSN